MFTLLIAIRGHGRLCGFLTKVIRNERVTEGGMPVWEDVVKKGFQRNRSRGTRTYDSS